MTGLDALKELVDSGGYVAEDVYRFYDGLNHMIEYNMTQETVQIFMGNRCTMYGLTDRKKLTFSENSQGNPIIDSLKSTSSDYKIKLASKNNQTALVQDVHIKAMILDEPTYDRINMLETPQIWYKDQDNLNKQGNNLTWSSKSQTSEMQAIIKDLTSLDKKNLYIIKKTRTVGENRRSTKPVLKYPVQPDDLDNSNSLLINMVQNREIQFNTSDHEFKTYWFLMYMISQNKWPNHIDQLRETLWNRGITQRFKLKVK